MSYIQSVDKTVTVQKNFCIFYLFIFTPALAEAAGQASRSSNLFWPGFPKLSDKSYLTFAQPTIVFSSFTLLNRNNDLHEKILGLIREKICYCFIEF
jgi:hypothetical protein